MRKEDKAQIIDQLVAQLEATPNFYVADIAGLNAENTTELRRACFEKGIKLVVVKNTLFVKALDRLNVAEAANITPSLKGSSAVMFTETPNAPAKLIKEFGAKMGKPALKSAFLQECAYVGAQHLEDLVNIKSREELIGDIIGLLQSPARNVISALTASGGGKIAGLVKTLSEKE
ncbi:MAG: 50S ribosomal protein L10 [Bacteroidales bacterium]|jgi:large subunit ribosomal protein L10|nr:50S ribosomal protein L10 [Bacteroidales bacterium]MBO7320572.1 50S ribosomal protein L10 [Bacteroidales bacterium]MBO7764428.1 50S ribosomal protein L10 [Bacteroidales bacterium]MBQ2243757.1 50S ribosomal protein L10 [Bacteroidales bacterium]